MAFSTFEKRSVMYSHLLKANDSSLKDMPKLKIGCGISSGLPFDCLMTDVMSGCLNRTKVCYGNCTAAEFWEKQGYNFGKRVLNEFDEHYFIREIEKLPKDQKWLRQGWVSDCSFTKESWELTRQIADILSHFNRQLLIITKIHSLPNEDVLKDLAKYGSEIRVSLSALDTKTEYDRRTKFLNKYREIGGLAVPYVMSARFSDDILNSNQNEIINFVVKNDYVAGEHSLRVDKNNSIINYVKKDGFWHTKFPNQYWFGRVFHKIPNFVLPPPTHLKANYSLPTCYFSKLNTEIPGLDDNLPTFDELSKNPKQQSKGLTKHAAYVIQNNQ